jgi:hypothetical protein
MTPTTVAVIHEMKVPTPGKVGTYEPCEIVETSFVMRNLLGNPSDFKCFFQVLGEFLET